MANSPTDLLYELQCLDTALRNLTVELDELVEAASEVRAVVEQKRPVVLAKRHEMNEMERRRKEIEDELAAHGLRIKDARMRMQRIRNERELGALRREVEITREQDTVLEEELLVILESGDSKSGELAELEENLAKYESTFAERETAHKERSNELHAEVERRRGQRDAKAAEVDDSLRVKYELLLGRRAGRAVVPVERELCTGCKMLVPPQLIMQIYRRADLVTCPSCQRILCIPPARPAASGG